MFIQSEEYAEIGEKIKAELFPKLMDIQIAWLKSDQEKKHDGKIVFADCTKVAKKYKWSVPYDFMITVYEANCVDFTDDQIKILLEHELMHCGSDGKLVPHNIEEFRQIIDKYGIDWSVTEPIDYALLDD